MLTRITDWKISCAYIHVYWITKNWGPGPNNSLRHADNRGYFSGLSLTRNQREAHVLLGEGSGEIWTCSCWEKGNFIIINEFKYGQTWKIWPSPLNLSLYNPFKLFCHGSKRGTQDIDICQNDYNIPFKLEFPLILKSYNESTTFKLTQGFHSLIFFILMYLTISVINKSRPCYFVYTLN